MTRWTAAFEESLRSHHYPGQMALPGEFDQNSYLSDRPSTTVPVANTTPPLHEVEYAHKAMLAARQRFLDSVFTAVDAGHSNRAIGLAADMTEAGIRQILKRSNQPSRRERGDAPPRLRPLKYGRPI